MFYVHIYFFNKSIIYADVYVLVWGGIETEQILDGGGSTCKGVVIFDKGKGSRRNLKDNPKC